MTYDCFELTIEDRVAHLVLTRAAEMNALNAAFFRELRGIVATLHRDAPARALVISSTGKHFTAGMALEVFSDGGLVDPVGPADRGVFRELIASLQDAFTALERLRMPVIAVIQGGCIGGGVDLACACDIRYASADAFFCVQETNIGVAADLGTLQRLPKLIPEGVAREYAYSGRRMSAARARELGLVNEVHATQAEALAAAIGLAREIAAKAPTAIWATKQAITHARDHGVGESLDHMALLQSALWASDDLREAIAAMKGRRGAAFPDLPPSQAFG
jgi:enoyl-CoA hydratase